MIASQIYMFVAPGLYRSERKAFLPFLVATPILFLLGAALVYFVVMPLAMNFFLSMQQTGDNQVHIQLTARVSEYLSLIMTLILAFGICFQLPVLLTLLARAGLHHRRAAQGQAPHRHSRRLHRGRRAHPAGPDQPDRARAPDRAALRAVDLRREARREAARRVDLRQTVQEAGKQRVPASRRERRPCCISACICPIPRRYSLSP